ncbi:MAG: nodulation protein NfeD [Nitrospinota bacterium]|nr:nodulation protein NfeD [Nitrospinota bacterium]
MRIKRISGWLLLVVVGVALLVAGQSAAVGASKVLVISINDPIHPITTEFILETIDKANEAPAAELLVIEMDTPGGLMDSMKEIIKGIQASATPVAVFVSPSGSRAASAGAFITVASHIAAMTPGSNIGSASPVSTGGEMDRTMKRKVTNDASAYIRSLAEAHGRNADVAEKFVTKAHNITETEALEKNIIDLVARDLSNLLDKLEGWKVKTIVGEKVLSLKNAVVERREMNLRQRIFNVLVHPGVAAIFMSLGMLGIMIELYSPGAVFPGVVGTICLVLGLYSMQLLPINFAGVALIILAFVFFFAELLVPSFGALTLGGVVAMIVGAMMLVDTEDEYMSISLSVVAPMAIMMGGFSLFMARSMVKMRSQVSKSGQEELVGSQSVADTDISPDGVGKIMLFGEIWDARSDDGLIEKGTPVVVVRHQGLTLTVRPI